MLMERKLKGIELWCIQLKTRNLMDDEKLEKNGKEMHLTVEKVWLWQGGHELKMFPRTTEGKGCKNKERKMRRVLE